MNRISTPLLLALSLALLGGCSAPPGMGSARFAVSVSQALSASVSRVSVTASAPDFPSVSVDLSSSGGSWGGLLGHLPAGDHRSFLARAFDASGTELFEGSASDITLFPDKTALVAITLQQLNPPPPFQNAAPLIDSLVASSTSVTTGSSLSLTATAHDPNPGDTLAFAWSSTAGAFSSASTASTAWTAPSSTGPQTLTLTVTDARGLSTSLLLSVNVLSGGGTSDAQLAITFNTAPQVTSVSATTSQLSVGQSTPVSVSASDADGDSLSYTWSASCAGSWDQATSSTARFTPSALPAGVCDNCDLTVSVSDGRGGQTTGTLSLCVSTPPAPSHFNPTLLSVSSSSATATAGQVITYEVEARDPEGSALAFSWSANVGSPGTPTTTASSSHLTWTAPRCVPAGVVPHITATVANAFHQTATQSFSVTGLPVCVPASWAPTGSMATPRSGHTATRLLNGKVLVVGGGAKAELYDPASGTWSETGTPLVSHNRHTATLLPNGQVLVSGAYEISDKTEVYDPASGTWRATGFLAIPRVYGAVAPLPGGKALISGGIGDGDDPGIAEVYDPTAGMGTWRRTGSLMTVRFFHQATALTDGKVLLSGGINAGSGLLSSAELYDPASSTFSAVGSMATARSQHTATLLPGGKVLVTGGSTGGGSSALAELYDTASGTWSATAAMASAHSGHTATLLPGGKVLVTGGSTVEEYDPASGTWSAVASTASARSGHTATLLLDGRVLVVGGSAGSGSLATAELYTPGTP